MAYIPPTPPRRFDPRAPVPTMHPRKVRGGVKLENREGLAGLAWAGQRWMRLVEDCAPGHNLAEGTQYAKLGQVRSLNIATHGGLISARVQGRLPTAYVTEIRLPTFTHEQWEQALSSMAQEARHLASLLAGEVPPGIDDLFAPLHLRLFPIDASDLALSCSCVKAAAAIAARPPMSPGNAAQAGAEPAAPAPPPAPAPTPSTPWCKHVCCVMALLADRLSRDPFMVFALRGLSKEDLLERLRQRRALLTSSRSGGGIPDRPVAAYSPRIPGVGDAPAPALEHALAGFWQTQGDLSQLDLAMQAPDVSHPLLRRLGSSPFEEARFPLVGLLATCYEVLSTQALQSAESESAVSSDPELAELSDEGIALTNGARTENTSRVDDQPEIG